MTILFSFPSWAGPMVFLLFSMSYLLLSSKYNTVISRAPVEYTIRVNTFRRNDLLKQFLDHYSTCPEVKQITVVWSDPDNKPPVELGPINYPHSDVFYEIHVNNSLTNRFRAIYPVPTDVSGH
jgi:hypothetical protein